MLTAVDQHEVPSQNACNVGNTLYWYTANTAVAMYSAVMPPMAHRIRSSAAQSAERAPRTRAHQYMYMYM